LADEKAHRGRQSPLDIGENRLGFEDVWQVAVERRPVRVPDRSMEKLGSSRRFLEGEIRSGRIMYGVNTGFGRFAEIPIPENRIRELQKNLVLSHAAGVGPFFDDDVVRAILLLKAKSLSLGYSGVRPEIVRILVDMLNADILPRIPSKGSVGASGDLAPLAHMALVLLGLGQAHVDGKTISGKQALRRLGIPVVRLEAKEGLSLLNGTQAMAAMGSLAFVRARNLFDSADVAAALSVEAMSGSEVPFDDRIQRARGQKGQIVVAQNIRRMLAHSEILTEKPIKRVQEPYCLRCIPQVHGAGQDVLDFVAGILEREINGATDNPLVFAEDGDILSGGNFHGEPLALAMDALGMALTSLAGISERRIAALMDSNISGLPGFLSKRQGLHSGFMIAQVTAASLVSENRVLAHPASVDSIPTSANQEDYVSMGMTAAHKAVRILENTQTVLAIELLAACQGVELRAPLEPSPILSPVIRAFRRRVPPLLRDRILSEDISEAVSFIRSCEWKPALPVSLQFTKDGRS